MQDEKRHTFFIPLFPSADVAGVVAAALGEEDATMLGEAPLESGDVVRPGGELLLVLIVLPAARTSAFLSNNFPVNT